MAMAGTATLASASLDPLLGPPSTAEQANQTSGGRRWESASGVRSRSACASPLAPLDLEVPRMEGDRLGEVAVPVVPAMIAGILLVLVPEVHRIEVSVEPPVLAQQGVVLPAV